MGKMTVPVRISVLFAVLATGGFCIGCSPGVDEMNENALRLIDRKSYDAAEKILRSAVERQPTNAGLHANLAEVLVRTDRIEEALLEQRIAVENDQSGGPTFRRRLAEIEIRLNRDEDAVVGLGRLVDDFPRDLQARYLLAQTYLKTSKLREAGELIRESLAKKPKDVGLLTCQAALFIRTGKKKEATDILEQVVDKWSRSSSERSVEDGASLDALRMLADLYYEEGNPTESAKRYEICLEAGPDPAVELKLGKCYLDMGEREKAFSHLVKAGEGSSSVGAFLELAQAYYKMEKWDQAEEACNRAIWVDPTNVAARNLRGMTYARKGQRGLMLMDFEASLKQNPNQPEIREIINTYEKKKPNDGVDKGELEGTQKVE